MMNLGIKELLEPEEEKMVNDKIYLQRSPTEVKWQIKEKGLT